MPETHLIIGLGNPGREFAESRHNIGFMLLDRLSVLLNAQRLRLQSKALVSPASYQGSKVLLAKPQTYMNLSGNSIGSLARFYKVSFDRLLVAHDDMDLPLGTLRLRPGGGAGGQKGVASTIQWLGTTEFARLRIGIGRPPGRMDPAKYVLQRFGADELEEVASVLERAASAALCFVASGIQTAMNRYNSNRDSRESANGS
jgi:PTH1 family peptidyl-tRNA hydrolase